MAATPEEETLVEEPLLRQASDVSLVRQQFSWHVLKIKLHWDMGQIQ